MKINILDHGYVELLDTMGSDSDIVASARVSYGGDSKGDAKDRKLLNYLWRNRHTSPFEMGVMKFRVKAPIFVARQWVRHRTASWNEISARYTEVTHDYYMPERWRGNDAKNKQDSNDLGLTRREESALFTTYKTQCDNSIAAYEGLLRRGVAREQARMLLPQSMYTVWIWKMDVRNLLHFLSLRNHKHAQYEIRQYAVAIESLLAQMFPWTHAAYTDSPSS